MEKKRMLNLIIIFLFLLIFPSVLALKSGLCVNAEVSDISPSSIKIGDEFTIGIHIENCGTVLPQNTSFEILRLPANLSIKESLKIEIPKIQYANSERFIVLHMKVDDKAESGTYVIKTRLSYGADLKMIQDDEISIDVIGERAELSIASIKTSPVLPYKRDTVELTLRIENTGDGTAKSVQVYVNHSFQGLKQSFIGALQSDEDGPVILTFIANKRGEFEIPVTISYKDDFGENEIQTKINLTILRKKINWFLILFLIAIISFAIWGFRNYAKLKRTKDKIIHQLLGGEKEEKSEDIKAPEMIIESDTKKGTTKRVKKIDEEKKKKERRKKEFKEELLKKYKK
jgi:hypothetical protein